MGANRALTRRGMLLHAVSVLLGSGTSGPARAAGDSRPLVGAIRWDAWYDPSSPETQAATRSLAPREFHDRIPFFGAVGPDGNPRIDGNHQAVMDREVGQATQAGIDFWAFDAYERTSSMSIGLHLYRASRVPNKPRFCMFNGLLGMADKDTLTSRVRWHIELMSDSSYLRVDGGRPLYFINTIDLLPIRRRWGGIAGLNAILAEFRRSVQDAAGDQPYVVGCPAAGSPQAWLRDLDIDALGSYAITQQAGHQSFSALADLAQTRWDRLANAGFAVVPTVMTGWDRRPRIEHPVPWETWQKPNTGLGNYFDRPTPAELARHILAALRWVRLHAKSAPSRVILIYAWNENDEGGWLVPTLPFNTSRLEALRRATEQSR